MGAKRPYSAIFIDVYNQQVKEVKIQKLEDLQGLVKGYIEAVQVDDNLIMYINEEGRYTHPNIGFHIGLLTICGNGVIVHNDEYEDVPDETLALTKSIVDFWDRRSDEEKEQYS